MNNNLKSIPVLSHEHTESLIKEAQEFREYIVALKATITEGKSVAFGKSVSKGDFLR